MPDQRCRNINFAENIRVAFERFTGLLVTIFGAFVVILLDACQCGCGIVLKCTSGMAHLPDKVKKRLLDC